MRCLYLLLLFICILSCSKEQDGIPSMHPSDEHYTDVNPVLLWERNCSSPDDAEIASMGVLGDKVFVFLSNEVMRVYNSKTGKLISEGSHNDIFEYRSINEFELRERGSSIYVLDKSNRQVIQVDKASGEISDIYAPGELIYHYNSFGMQIIEDDIYFFKYDASNRYTLVKYNFITRQEQELHTFSSLNLAISANQPSLYSPEKRKFYACAQTKEDAFIILSFDLSTLELQVLFRYTENLDGFTTNELALHDNTLILELNDNTLYGIDVETGEVKWENRSGKIDHVSEIFSRLGRIYFTSRGKLFEIDINTGDILWQSPSFCEGTLFDIIPGEGLAVTVIKESELDDSRPGFAWNDFDRGTIYGLKTGQRLVEWDIQHPFGRKLWFRDICYHENDTSRHIYIAANNYLFKYDWPL